MRNEVSSYEDRFSLSLKFATGSVTWISLKSCRNSNISTREKILYEMADAVPQRECSKRSKSDEDAKQEIAIIVEERAAEMAALRAIKEAIRINGIRCSREESTRSPVTVASDSERESLFLFNTFAVDLIERANCT
jgi:hypothetical protein